MIEVELTYNDNLMNMDERLKLAIAAKLTQLTRMLYEKVIDNLSGKILQKQSGELMSSIKQSTDIVGDHMTGRVFVDPPSAKAYALEFGGKSFYPIDPVKARVLHWISKEGESVFRMHVDHPPSKEFAYLRTALEEMKELVPEGFNDAITSVFAGGSI